MKYISSFIMLGLFCCSVWAKDEPYFRIEKDSILHICRDVNVSDFSSKYIEAIPWNSVFKDVREIDIDEGVSEVHLLVLDFSFAINRIKLPSTLKCFRWNDRVDLKIKEWILNEKNPYFTIEDGSLLNKSKNVLVFPVCVKDSIFTVPETIDSVLSFYTDMQFHKFVFPENLKFFSGDISGDSLFVYSDSIKAKLFDFKYIYIENDEVYGRYILYKKRNEGNWWLDGDAQIFCPNLDKKKRDYRLLQNRKNAIIRLKEADALPIWNQLTAADAKDVYISIPGIRDENLMVYQNGKLLVASDDGSYHVGIGKLEYGVFTYDTILPLSQITELKVTESPHYHEENGVVFTRDKTKLLRYSLAKKDSVYEIPSSVDSVLCGFYGKHLKKLTVPHSVDYIGSGIHCDSLLFYSPNCQLNNHTEAKYIYIESEDVYLHYMREIICRQKRRSHYPVVFCPNGNIGKRRLDVANNRNEPLVDVLDGSKLDCYSPMQYKQVKITVEGISDDDLRVFQNDENALAQNKQYVIAGNLNYGVCSYDTLIMLPQETKINLMKRDSVSSEVYRGSRKFCLVHIPEGKENMEDFLYSQEKIRVWKDGSVISKDSLSRAVLVIMYDDSWFSPIYGNLQCQGWGVDKNNYVYPLNILSAKNIGFIPDNRRLKEIWLTDLKWYCPDCIPIVVDSIHFFLK